MNKYIYAECPVDVWPSIKSVMAISYNDAVDKLLVKYSDSLEDEDILKFDTFESFRDYLNNNYEIALSDLEIYEEL